jgi:hypothetical protein
VAETQRIQEAVRLRADRHTHGKIVVDLTGR